MLPDLLIFLFLVLDVVYLFLILISNFLCFTAIWNPELLRNYATIVSIWHRLWPSVTSLLLYLLFNYLIVEQVYGFFRFIQRADACLFFLIQISKTVTLVTKVVKWLLFRGICDCITNWICFAEYLSDICSIILLKVMKLGHCPWVWYLI